MHVERHCGLLVRTQPDSLQEIATRHTPLRMEDALLCPRCDEIWPCDSRQLLDHLGVPRTPFINLFGHVVDGEPAVEQEGG
jgi:hypothetical protein